VITFNFGTVENFIVELNRRADMARSIQRDMQDQPSMKEKRLTLGAEAMTYDFVADMLRNSDLIVKEKDAS
jgi:hypothetical protein